MNHETPSFNQIIEQYDSGRQATVLFEDSDGDIKTAIYSGFKNEEGKYSLDPGGAEEERLYVSGDTVSDENQARLAEELGSSRAGDVDDEASVDTIPRINIRESMQGTNEFSASEATRRELGGIATESTATQLQEEHESTTEERLVVNKEELALIDELMGDIGRYTGYGAEGYELDHIILNKYQGVVEAIDHMNTTGHDTAQALASLIASGAVEDVRVAYEIAERASNRLVAEIGHEDADILHGVFREAINMKSYPDTEVSADEKLGYLYKKLMTNIETISPEDKPVMVAALLAFGAGTTGRNYEMAGVFKSRLVELIEGHNR